MDAAGAAAGNCSCTGMSVVFAICTLVKKGLPFTIARNDFSWNAQCGKFLQIGLPLALQEFLTQLSFLALCAFVNRLGLEASSGYGVACKIVNFAMLVPSALMQSMASFVSQNVGAGKAETCKTDHVHRYWRRTCGRTALYFALVMFRGDLLAGIFSDGCGSHPKRL